MCYGIYHAPSSDPNRGRLEVKYSLDGSLSESPNRIGCGSNVPCEESLNRYELTCTDDDLKSHCYPTFVSFWFDTHITGVDRLREFVIYRSVYIGIGRKSLEMQTDTKVNKGQSFMLDDEEF